MSVEGEYDVAARVLCRDSALTANDVRDYRAAIRRGTESTCKPSDEKVLPPTLPILFPYLMLRGKNVSVKAAEEITERHDQFCFRKVFAFVHIRWRAPTFDRAAMLELAKCAQKERVGTMDITDCVLDADVLDQLMKVLARNKRATTKLSVHNCLYAHADDMYTLIKYLPKLEGLHRLRVDVSHQSSGVIVDLVDTVMRKRGAVTNVTLQADGDDTLAVIEERVCSNNTNPKCRRAEIGIDGRSKQITLCMLRMPRPV